jgi:Rrf2 family protein
MRLSRKADYAIRAMVDLSTQPKGVRVAIHDIAKRQDIPYTFLPRIIPDLVKGGLLKSYRGANGGILLARSPEDITILKIIEMTDGPVNLNRCTAYPSECDRMSTCPIHGLWKKVQDDFNQNLGKTSLADIVNGDRAFLKKT